MKNIAYKKVDTKSWTYEAINNDSYYSFKTVSRAQKIRNKYQKDDICK